MDQEEVWKRLDALGGKLGVATEFLWGVLVKQQVVEAVYGAIAVGLWLCLMTWLVRNYKSLIARVRKGWHDDDPFVALPTCIGGIVGFVLTIFILAVGLPACINGFLNPEYGALKEILETVKGK